MVSNLNGLARVILDFVLAEDMEHIFTTILKQA
jgi:hypothetical protein